MTTLAKIRKLGAEYDGKRVLDNINLDIASDDYLGIIGPNGGGKTTFVKCLLGLKEPSEGSIEFYKGGQRVKRLDIGYMPQYSAIDSKFPITVREAILSGTLRRNSLLGGWSRQQRRDADETISRMGLEGLADTNLGELSGGQRQRALLGRAIIGKPDMLILDEPNTYVDKMHEARLYGLLEELNARCAIIVVSHDITTIVSNVKSLACIDYTIDCQSDPARFDEWLKSKSINLTGQFTARKRPR